jgi:hypothetical protein
MIGYMTVIFWFVSQHVNMIFMLSELLKPALRPTLTPILWVCEAPTPEVKQLGHKNDHSHPSTAEGKNECC